MSKCSCFVEKNRTL